MRRLLLLLTLAAAPAALAQPAPGATPLPETVLHLAETAWSAP